MDEREPLLPYVNGSVPADLGDPHAQFCQLVGARPVNLPEDERHRPHPRSLYARALKRRGAQSCTYMFTATLVNTLLLTQIVLGAALTGLGASNSSRILITVFGALNTIIAGLIAFLKSRGQPMRSRMFKDDLSRVVDEIENSAVMWYGISAAAHGYDAIDVDDQVTVRSEVARLTRLYDKAVKTNTMNDPDMYAGGSGGLDSYSAGLRKGGPLPGGHGVVGAGGMLPATGVGDHAVAAAVTPAGFGAAGVPPHAAAGPVAVDPDASPASKPPEQRKPEEDSAPPSLAESARSSKSLRSQDASTTDGLDIGGLTIEDKGKEVVRSSSASTPAPASAPAPTPATTPAPVLAHDPDESPASAVRVPRKEDSSMSHKTLVNSDRA